MAEEKLLENLSIKLDGVADDVRTATYRLDKLENRFDKFETRLDSMAGKVDNLTDVVRDLSGNVKNLSNQFGSVISKVIENDNRLDNLENRVTN